MDLQFRTGNLNGCTNQTDYGHLDKGSSSGFFLGFWLYINYMYSYCEFSGDRSNLY
jgi:hypothetical protein